MEDWKEDYFDHDILKKCKCIHGQCNNAENYGWKEYELVLEKYYIEMKKYKNLSWFKKLFAEKPVKPIIDWFVLY